MQQELDLVHKALHSVLQKLTTELESAGIFYWLDFGTCLGAIRQQDFIPWDDDVDIAILRSDAPRFTQVVLEKLSGLVDISVQSINRPIAVPVKLELKGFHVIEEHMESKGVPSWLHPNIGIDVFLIDSRKRKPNQILRIFRHLLAKMWQAKQIEDWIGKASSGFSPFWRKFKYAMVRPVSRQFLCKLIDLEIKLNCSVEESRFLVHGVDCEFEYLVHDSKAVFPLKKTAFRQSNFAIPQEQVSYLDRIYGADFMQPPISSKRLTHSSQLLIASDSPLVDID